MLVVVAVIALVLGLATSLARDVRERVRGDLVIDVLRALEAAADAYADAHGSPPVAPPLAPADVRTLETWTPAPGVSAGRAAANNLAIIDALGPHLVGDVAAPLELLTTHQWDGERLLDPWGRPIVYEPGGTGLFGTAPGDRRFFMSAGPDRDYRSRGDNFYSYEHVDAPASPASPSAGVRVDNP